MAMEPETAAACPNSVLRPLSNTCSRKSQGIRSRGNDDLAGRFFGVVVHGDAAGAETLRRSLSDWLTDMALISAGRVAELDGYIGYMEPYATSHDALDRDHTFQQEVTNTARALANAVKLAGAGKLADPGEGLADPNPK